MPHALRPITPADLEAVHALCRRIESADGIPIATPLAEFEEWLSDPHLDPATDTRMVEEGGGAVAWGRIWHRPSGEIEERAFLIGGVAPEARGRGLGRALLAWQIERAREILLATRPVLPRYVRAQAYDFEAATLRLYRRHGLAIVRYASEMLRDLDAPPALVPTPGIAIVPWDRQRDEEARHVVNDAFRDHWGGVLRGAEAWQHELAAFGSRLDLSFFAVAGNRIVGATRNAHFPGDRAVTGRLDGWIQQVGVLRSHRKRGIASALISASLAAFAEAGLTHAALGVDSENPTGALRLYERLGFRAIHRMVVHQIEV